VFERNSGDPVLLQTKNKMQIISKIRLNFFRYFFSEIGKLRQFCWHVIVLVTFAIGGASSVRTISSHCVNLKSVFILYTATTK